MQVLNVTNLPIYLPYDKAPLPFGDVFDDGSATLASPAVFTAVGYVPTVGDSVGISVDAGGTLDAAFSVGTRYFVKTSPGNNTFTLSATNGGAAINSTAASSGLSIHLLSGQVDGSTLPFKPSSVAVVLNLTAGSLTLQSAPDSGTSGQYGRPAGPGSWSTVKFANGTAGGGVVGAGAAALVQLDNDWIRVSTAATLVLLQN